MLSMHAAQPLYHHLSYSLQHLDVQAHQQQLAKLAAATGTILACKQRLAWKAWRQYVRQAAHEAVQASRAVQHMLTYRCSRTVRAWKVNAVHSCLLDIRCLHCHHYVPLAIHAAGQKHGHVGSRNQAQWRHALCVLLTAYLCIKTRNSHNMHYRRW